MHNQDPEALLTLFQSRGGLQYTGEAVTQLQHAWQSLQLARQAGAAPALSLAAFFHDVGHLLTDDDGSPTLDGHDDRHEAVGARLVARHLGPEVANPVALHVAAKRYLVGSQPDYLQALSDDSVRSLALQGGPMTVAEQARFVQLPGADAALQLRRWDEQAKDGSAAVPPWAEVAAVVRGLWQSASAG